MATSKVLSEAFNHEWYIIISTSDRVKIETLIQELRDEHGVETIPWTQKIAAKNSALEHSLLGVKKVANAKLAGVRKAILTWNGEGKVISRKVFLEGDWTSVGDIPNEAAPELEDDTPSSPSETPRFLRPDAGFIKTPGSNPAQVRAAFLKYQLQALPTPTVSALSESATLQECLKRIRYDPGLVEEEYMVGFIDQRKGILEMRLAEWEGIGKWEVGAFIRRTEEEKDGEEGGRGEIVWIRR